MYIDILLLINFFIDFILLYSVSKILKRNVKVKRIILGAVIGSLSMMLLTTGINLNLFIYKIVIGMILCIVTFGFKDLKYSMNNFLYFYAISIILGGALNLLDFKNNNIFIVGMYLLIGSFLVVYFVIKLIRRLKNNYSLTYKVDIYLNNGEIIRANGYLDTANKLIEPYKRRSVILVNSVVLRDYINKNPFILVPYDTIDSKGMLKCITPKKVIVSEIGTLKNVVVGYNDKNYNMDGIDCILNSKILEER